MSVLLIPPMIVSESTPRYIRMQMPLTVRGLSGAGLHLGPQGKSRALTSAPDVSGRMGWYRENPEKYKVLLISWGRKGVAHWGGGAL